MIQDTRRNKNIEKKQKKNHTKYWHETHTKRNSFETGKREKIRLHPISSLFLPVSGKSAPCFLHVFPWFSVSHTLSQTHSQSPHQQKNCTLILLHSLHILQRREQKIQNEWIEKKRVKEKQIFNRVKKEYEKERKETNRNSYRRIAKCGVCAMRRRNSKKAKTN